ncbi:LOW QUALITY PROTEIN: hypothetical protein ACHAXR_006340 [Thalassiosira sp. AJA248-18]
MAMSSNDCENFFGMLAKYSHGKRTFLGQTDSWEVYQLLVAGGKSDDHFADKTVQDYHGIIVLSHIINVNTAKLIKPKQYNQKQQQGDKYKQCRKVRQYAKVKDAAKNKKSANNHCSNKVSPKETCKSKDSVPRDDKKPRAKPSRKIEETKMR